MKRSEVFDLKAISAYLHGEREKNVFYRGTGFQTRIIELPPQGNLPKCRMETAVIFYVVSGAVEVTVSGEKHLLTEGHCLIGEPGGYSMQTASGARLLGVQIETEKSGLRP